MMVSTLSEKVIDASQSSPWIGLGTVLLDMMMLMSVRDDVRDGNDARAVR